MYSGRPLKAINYHSRKSADGWDKSEWFSVKPVLQKRNPMINLPYIEMKGNPDEGKEDLVLVTQSNACLSYLARKLDMYGSNEFERSWVDQLLMEIMDIRNTAVGFAYRGYIGEELKSRAPDNLKRASGNFLKIENYLSRRIEEYGASGTFLVGESATAPDFHLYEMIDQFATCAKVFDLENDETNPANEKGTTPTLAKFYKAFGALPKMQAYLQSPLAKRPMNNPAATFGGGLDGKPWSEDVPELSPVVFY